MEGQLLVERYRVTRRLGQGGFATVYEAEHVELGSKVAIKTLDSSRRSEEAIGRFLREAQALTRLVHPCAVKVFDRGRTDDGQLWIAMELLEGETLEQRLNKGVLFPADVVALFRPICELLTEAHAKGIVHRDLKPANVMLAPVAGGGWSPKLFDFGIAALRDDATGLTEPDLVSGTPRYMAPEQWQGLKFADARADIYSLGVIAYECLSGALPLEADGALAWRNKHRYEPPRELRDAMAGRPLPRGMRTAIMTALRKEPGERQASALELWQGLSAGLDAAVDGDDEVVEARPSRRQILGWAAIPVVIGGVGAAWYVAAGSDRDPPVCEPLPGTYMPLTLGTWWSYRVVEPGTNRAASMLKTLRIDQIGDIGGRKAGTTAARLERTDADGSAYRWLGRHGDAVVWHHDQWFDVTGALTAATYYEPRRMRVDDACAHRVAGARWIEDYARVDVDVGDPAKLLTTRYREEWSVVATDEEVVVPAGTFRCLRLHRRRVAASGPQSSTYWFAAGIGKIKEDSAPEELEELVAFHVAPA